LNIAYPERTADSHSRVAIRAFCLFIYHKFRRESIPALYLSLAALETVEDVTNLLFILSRKVVTDFNLAVRSKVVHVVVAEKGSYGGFKAHRGHREQSKDESQAYLMGILGPKW
jgi:hypothetical protein